MHKRSAHAFFAVLLASSSAGITDVPPRRPNVLFLWVDDVGYGDLGAFGNNTMLTPNVDRLAKAGAMLTAHYVASPICTPSRAALLTGRHAIRSGMTSDRDNFNVMGLGPGRLHEQDLTIAEVLRAEGYATAMVGKCMPTALQPSAPRRLTRALAHPLQVLP
jgi:arylsulfatase A-like enzyme